MRNACSPVAAVVTSYPAARSQCSRVSRKIGLLSTTRMRSGRFLFMVASRALPSPSDGLSATPFEARFQLASCLRDPSGQPFILAEPSFRADWRDRCAQSHLRTDRLQNLSRRMGINLG